MSLTELCSVKENPEDNESWTGWAWSYVSSVLPAPWEDEWDHEELKNHSGHTLHIGFYVDQASITFKVYFSDIFWVALGISRIFLLGFRV